MNKKLYVSQPFEDNKIIPILNNNDIGIEIIEFGIGDVLDKGDKAVEDYMKLGKRIGHIHLHNNNSLKDTHSGLKNGNIDIESILNLIDNCCDNPSMTIEVNNIDEVEECILFLLNRYIIK